MKNSLTLAVTATLFFVFSCQDPDNNLDSIDKPVDTEMHLLSKIVNDHFTQTFFYDDENRLVRQMLFDHEELKDVIDYNYLGTNSREKVLTVYIDGEEYSGSGIETFNEHNLPNNRIGITIHIGNNTTEVNIEDDQFTYDENGRLSQMQCFANGQLGMIVNYEVDENGDIIRKEYTGVAHSFSSEYLLKYDQQKHHMHYSTFGLANEPIYHNITEREVSLDGVRDLNASYSSVFEYTPNGLPVMETRRFADGREQVVTYEYY